MLLITCQLCNRSIERERMLPLSAGVATAADAGAAVYSCGSKYITKWKYFEPIFQTVQHFIVYYAQEGFVSYRIRGSNIECCGRGAKWRK